MTSNVFDKLTESLSVTQAPGVSRWWWALSAGERGELARLLGEDSPRVIGRFVRARQQPLAADAIPNVDFYEYLVNHELSLDDGRKFHICSAHPGARAAVVSGEIPAAFSCPLSNEKCPMRLLLGSTPGCDVRLSIGRRAPAAEGGSADE